MHPTQSLSPLAIKAIVDVVTGGSANDDKQPIGLYRTGPAMERLMLDRNLDFRVGTSSRYPALQNFLRETARQTDGLARLARVIARVCDERDYDGAPEKHTAVVEHLNRMLEQDGYEVVKRGGWWQLQAKAGAALVVDQIVGKAAILDFDTVQRDVERALASADNDPEDAVTAACSMVESVCRSILVELSLELPARKDIDGLLRAVQEPLGLKPGRADLPDDIAADVRQVLQGLTTAVQGIGALRTHAGDAHGRERRFARIDARIARLAIHAASTAALFLIETWQRKHNRALPKAA